MIGFHACLFYMQIHFELLSEVFSIIPRVFNEVRQQRVQLCKVSGDILTWMMDGAEQRREQRWFQKLLVLHENSRVSRKVQYKK